MAVDVTNDTAAVMLTALKDMGKLIIVSVEVPAPKAKDEEEDA